MRNDLKRQGEQSFTFAPAIAQREQRSETPPPNAHAQAVTKRLDDSVTSNGRQETFSTNPPMVPLTFELGSPQAPTTLQETTTPLRPAEGKSSANMGYALAGLCTTVAAILLLFVFMIVQTLPPDAASLHSVSTLAVTSTPLTHFASPTASAPTATPTATYPGQQYISGAQTAQFVNGVTGEPTNLSTTFGVGQKIYISFQVHPAGQVGAICLLWYINATQFASYPFSLNTTNTTLAYSYAITENTGTGYVEIYWETTPSCVTSNKLLGDRVNFTVTA